MIRKHAPPDPLGLRRRKLLDIMLAALVAVNVLMVVALLITAPLGLAGSDREVDLLWTGTLLLPVLLAVIFAISRYLSVDLAGILFSLSVLLLAILSDEPKEVVDGRTLFIFTIPIIASSVLIRPWASFVLASVSALTNAVIALAVFQATPNVPAILSFFLLATVSWLSARSLEQALAESRAANRDLQASQKALQAYSETLEERVHERTKALENAQEELVRREKLAALGQLAGGLGNELRNPLGVIANAVYYLDAVRAPEDKHAQEYLDIISSEVRTATRIVSDLLALAFTRAPSSQPVSVAELVAYVMGEYVAPAEIEVQVDVPPNLPTVLVDPGQIRQAMIHIVANAYQAMPDGGRLAVRAWVEDLYVSISVTDTGSGIDPEDQKQVFEPLFTTKARGMGLGLAVSRNLVESNGGQIRLQSTVGQGSTFAIRLPCHPTNHVPPE